MVTTILGITASILAGAAGYFAYRMNQVNDQYLDQKVKFESVISYSKSLEEQLKATTVKATKTQKVAAANTKAGKTEAPKKRGRKPSSK